MKKNLIAAIKCADLRICPDLYRDASAFPPKPLLIIVVQNGTCASCCEYRVLKSPLEDLGVQEAAGIIPKKIL